MVSSFAFYGSLEVVGLGAPGSVHARDIGVKFKLLLYVGIFIMVHRKVLSNFSDQATRTDSLRADRSKLDQPRQFVRALLGAITSALVGCGAEREISPRPTYGKQGG